MEPEPPSTDTDGSKRQPRQQLTAGMEHMRSYVVIPDKPTSQATPSTGKTGEEAGLERGEDAYGVPAQYQPMRSTTTTSPNNAHKRSDPFQFGTRFLEEGDDIFAHNAWDHVSVEPEYASFIAAQTAFQREHAVSDFDAARFNEKPEKWWDRFYANNAANFFKDRKWLVQEFPVLGDVTKAEHGGCTLLEVGAGAGNTAFPLLGMNANPDLRIHAVDYSAQAVSVIRSHAAYADQDVLRADVWDAAGAALPAGLEPGSVDVILMIFIFSALAPSQWTQAVRNAYTLLKPGGEILFRDYGRGDLAQVRFKKGRWLEENFYVRGDGTRVYFFDEEELRAIWGGVDSSKQLDEVHDDQKEQDQDQPGQLTENQKQNNADVGETPRFEIQNLAVDRRMLVNRQRKLKMYRCWMQGRFKKPGTTT